MADTPNFDNLNDQAAEFRNTLGSITKAYNDLLRSNADLTSEFGQQKMSMQDQTRYTKQIAEVGNKILKTKKDTAKLDKAVLDLANKRKTQEAQIRTLQAQMVNATDSQKQAIQSALKLQHEALDVTKSQEALMREAAEHSRSTEASSRRFAKHLKTAVLAYNVISTRALVNNFLELESSVLDTAKQLGISRDEAFALKTNLFNASFAADNLAVTSISLLKSQKSLNDAMGTGLQFSMDTLSTMTLMTDAMGLSEEAAVGFAKMAESSGMSAEQLKIATLDIAGSLQQQTGIQLDNRRILEDVSKVSGQVRANFGDNPALIAEAVTQAKLLGAEMDDINATANSLLDFESSIEAELRAELITGKQLNLERARAASLAGDQATLAEELQTQLGSAAEFGALNVLQQRELAAAFGLSADRVADILQQQEIQANNARSLKGLSGAQIAADLEQLSVQQQMAKIQESFMATAAQLAPVVMPVIDGFASLVEFLGKSKALMIGLVSVAAGLKAAALATSIAQIFGREIGTKGLLGIATAGAATAAMIGAIGSAQSVSDGIAPAGNGPFTITDGYGRTAITARGDGLAVSPNINNGGGGQPVIIQNTFSNFQASGPYQLAETQRRQASPTFA